MRLPGRKLELAPSEIYYTTDVIPHRLPSGENINECINGLILDPENVSDFTIYVYLLKGKYYTENNPQLFILKVCSLLIDWHCPNIDLVLIAFA